MTDPAVYDCVLRQEGAGRGLLPIMKLIPASTKDRCEAYARREIILLDKSSSKVGPSESILSIAHSFLPHSFVSRFFVSQWPELLFAAKADGHHRQTRAPDPRDIQIAPGSPGRDQPARAQP